jgi:hypothetical protein
MKPPVRTPAIAAFLITLALTPLGAALSPDAGDPVVNLGNNTLVKLSEANGAVIWSVAVANDGALAIDPADSSVYTAIGGHLAGTDGTIYKFNANGTPSWTQSISLNSSCDFQFVTNAAVDASSSSPGVVWSESGCFGALAKSDRATGLQQWSAQTLDLDRPSIDPSSGQIFAVTNAGGQTIYSVTAGGTLASAASCEGFIDLNPADGMLYRGGGNAQANGCGTTLSQMNPSVLGATNWSVDLSSTISSLDALAVQPWQGGYVYAASVADSKIAVVNPATHGVVTSFSTAIPPTFIAIDPNGGNVYVANNQKPFVLTYSPTGALVWINLSLGGNVTNLATPKGVVGVPASSPTPTPTPTPSATPECPVPTVKISTDRTSLNMGQSATISMDYGAASAPPCQDVTVYFHAGSQKAKANIDYTLTDANGQDATSTETVVNGPLILHNLYTSRKKTSTITIKLLSKKTYNLGKSASVKIQLFGSQ